jgi:hypothetical protein
MTRNSTISKRRRVFRPWAEALALTMLTAMLGSTAVRAAAVSEPASCRTVRLADVGWTDVTATTAVLGTLLRDLSYDAQTTLLSVPVTFASMKRGNIDVFLGNWMPAQTNDRRPYLEDRSIEVVRENLSGAKYTLAVPAYTYAAGLRELPSAAPLILAGITQCIMLSLSMVVIAALVGAGGLGVPVVRALGTVQIGMGVEAGFVIVLLAVILDRVMRIRRVGNL